MYCMYICAYFGGISISLRTLWGPIATSSGAVDSIRERGPADRSFTDYVSHLGPAVSGLSLSLTQKVRGIESVVEREICLCVCVYRGVSELVYLVYASLVQTRSKLAGWQVGKLARRIIAWQDREEERGAENFCSGTITIHPSYH